MTSPKIDRNISKISQNFLLDEHTNLCPTLDLEFDGILFSEESIVNILKFSHVQETETAYHASGMFNYPLDYTHRHVLCMPILK